MIGILVSLVAMISLCVIASISDIKIGIVRNKVLAVYAVFALVFNLARIICLERYMAKAYMINVLLMLILSLILFYSHSLAGGDCKLAIVLALLYPFDCYLIYDRSIVTLQLTIVFALVYGYVYLVMTSIVALIRKKNKITKEYVCNYLKAYAKSFVAASVYISLICDVVYLLACKGIHINVWIIRGICILVAWIVGRNTILKKKVVILLLGLIIGIFGAKTKYISFIGDVYHYVFVAIMLLCQMSVRTNLYETIGVAELKEKMILTTVTSMTMQNSRVRGLPGISSEDLGDRLTEKHVESIKRWAKGNQVESLSIVKKIPFAVFISLGFITYCVLWGVFV